ncbi:MAG: hypothetical protein ABI539_01730 [Acidobacteriota bacterium]
MAAPFSEFADDKRLLWIAREWENYSDRLADWAMEHLVNRRDVWSQYTISHGEVGVVMLPIKARRKAGTDMVTINKLRRHFAGRAVSHLIGLHSISDHATCKWFAVDVDLHEEQAVNADEIASANFSACLEWAARLRSAGFDPLLMDSNGVGGFHLWTLLDGEYPLADVYDLVSELRDDYSDFGLPKKPEVFPPKRAVKKDDLPYGLRLPGRHHKRRHYTRIWNFESQADENEWLEGGDAIERMLATVTASMPGRKKKRVQHSSAQKKVRSPVPDRSKPTVCLDLDGVLSKYEGWDGPDVIGPPLPGALEFVRELSKFAEIVIFTSRASPESGTEGENSALPPGRSRIKVIEWLEKHKFPFSDVYAGAGKPKAAAFIDDRAVACRPQVEKDSYPKALKAVRELVSRSRKTLDEN